VKLLARLLALLGLSALGFFLLTIPNRLDDNAIAATGSGVAVRGERIFWAGGCASCHAAADAKGDDRLKLGGGAPLETPFGTFYGPNLSPHADGLGDWTLAEFANAMQRGVGKSGRHLYPAFPYTSYAKMTAGDVADLYAYLKSLPPVAGKAPENALAFPYNVRRGLGLWKLVFGEDGAPIIPLPDGAPDDVRAGQYLVEGPGHCGQCHTPRTLGGLGALDHGQWLGGAPNPDGRGRIPNITPGALEWSGSEIADYLATGFTPEYDSVGGSMVEVQANMAKLTADDRAAIAAYLKAVPAHKTK
jgi:mono/diheme cytochrome c family protein